MAGLHGKSRGAALVLVVGALVSSCAWQSGAPKGRRFQSLDGSSSARVEGGRVLIDGRRPGPQFEMIANPGVSLGRSGLHVAYVGVRDGGAYAVVDEDALGPYTAWATRGPKIGPAGRTSFAMKRGDEWVHLLDGVEGPPLDGILADSPVFSDDGTRAAIGVRKGAAWSVTLAGSQMGTSYDELMSSYFTFSKHSARFAFAARRGEKWLAVIDGFEGPALDLVSAVALSPHQVRAVYAGVVGGMATRRGVLGVPIEDE
jgi:hypothetical protein